MQMGYVLVTGASRGIGQEIATGLSEDGWNIIVHYNKSESEAEEVAEKCRKNRVDAFCVGADLSKSSGIESLTNTIRERGQKISGLINNAGLVRLGTVKDFEDSDWDEVFSLNLRAPAVLVKNALQIFDRPGSIVNISSAAGIRPGTTPVAYEASKAALIHLTRSMAISLGPDIRVNAIAPGWILTDLNRGYLESEGVKEKILKRTPIKRLGTAKDVADAVRFLMSQKASFITGQTLSVDGGITL